MVSSTSVAAPPPLSPLSKATLEVSTFEVQILALGREMMRSKAKEIHAAAAAVEVPGVTWLSSPTGLDAEAGCESWEDANQWKVSAEKRGYEVNEALGWWKENLERTVEGATVLQCYRALYGYSHQSAATVPAQTEAPLPAPKPKRRSNRTEKATSDTTQAAVNKTRPKPPPKSKKTSPVKPLKQSQAKVKPVPATTGASSKAAEGEKAIEGEFNELASVARIRRANQS